MILFSPAKINIGLHILARRIDGFHNLQSLMYPVGLSDILEIREAPDSSEALQFSQSGIHFESDFQSNLCVRAWSLLKAETTVPALEIHLHKQIPVGAGLGGGSSNASTVLRGVNQLAPKPVSEEVLMRLAGELGSDCPFFLKDAPQMIEGRGEILRPALPELQGLYLLLLFPEIHISTAEAYAGVQAAIPEYSLDQLISAPIRDWKKSIINDFEPSIFDRHPEIRGLKEALYDAGALYASLSGSGSALYGIFQERPQLSPSVEKYLLWSGPV